METPLENAESNCHMDVSNTCEEHINSMATRLKDRVKNKKIVFIWDMDETLILLKSLLSGQYAKKFNGKKDVQHGKKIGRRWETLILKVCDEHFFYEQLENINEPHLDTWKEYDDGADLTHYDFSKDGLAQPFDDANRRKLAYRFRSIGIKYEQGIEKMLEREDYQTWQDLYDVSDAYTDEWLSAARMFLEDCLKKNVYSESEAANSKISQEFTHNGPTQNVNVLVTSGTLVPTFVKSLLFRLDGFFSHDNVYSAWDVGKLQCFSWIKKRFEGADVQFCVIGDSMEECQAAEIMRWPFIKIDIDPDIGHRFPGLAFSTLKHYMRCIYENSDNEDGAE